MSTWDTPSLPVHERLTVDLWRFLTLPRPNDRFIRHFRRRSSFGHSKGSLARPFRACLCGSRDLLWPRLCGASSAAAFRWILCRPSAVARDLDADCCSGRHGIRAVAARDAIGCMVVCAARGHGAGGSADRPRRLVGGCAVVRIGAVLTFVAPETAEPTLNPADRECMEILALLCVRATDAGNQ
jgi:hypothetical protein